MHDDLTSTSPETDLRERLVTSATRAIIRVQLQELNEHHASLVTKDDLLEQ